MKVENVGKVVQALNKAKDVGGEGKVTVVVGYTASYALFVHEDLEAHHEVGQAKYLEQPARELEGELGSIIVKALRVNGRNFAQAMLLAGLRLQRESQLRCPVKYGFLKASAFTVIE